MGWRDGLGLFVHCGQECLPRLVERPILGADDVVDAAIRQSVRHGQHFYRERANPLEIDETGDVPILVDGNVALVEVSGL